MNERESLPGEGVAIRRQVFAALARASLWPAGHSGGGLLLGRVFGATNGIAGAVQTWYRDGRGRTTERHRSEYAALLQTYPVIGTFTAGSPDGTPHTHLALLHTVAAEPRALMVTARQGTVTALQAGQPVPYEVSDTLPDMPVSVGLGGDPGLEGSGMHRWLSRLPGLALVLVLLAGGFGLAAYLARPVAPAPEGAQASPLVAEPSPPPPEVAGPPVLEPPRPVLPAVHQVQPGETLGSIALEYYGTADLWEIIRHANRLPGTEIVEGDWLIIPGVD